MKIIIYIILYITTCKTCCADNIIENKFLSNHTFLNIYIILIFLSCYILITLEEFIYIKKSKSTMIAAITIWITISIFANEKNESIIINESIKKILLEYCELFLFLLVAMTYINSIKTFGVLEKLKNIILSKNLSYKKIFWIINFLTFFISPIADNLTTALIMCSITNSIGKNKKSFIKLTSISIVIAANAGGAFSPFGDITTLMIWQKNIINFNSFFHIFIPSLISFLIPALLISIKIPKNKPSGIFLNEKPLKKEAKILILMFISTIAFTIMLQMYLKLQAAIGMMAGLSLLQIFEYIQNKKYKNSFNLSYQISKIEWETLLFFYGIMLCVNGLAVTGILHNISIFAYNELGSTLGLKHIQTPANIIIGFLSALIDNIPITFAVLNMNLNMSEGQWLLMTLTTGIGGSLLSVGSAAGIAVMGQSKKIYTFFSHLKWSWAILLGYIFGVIIHIQLNNFLF